MSNFIAWLEPTRGASTFWKILRPLITIDLTLVAIYLLLEVARVLGVIEPSALTRLMAVPADRTIPEFFQYFKWLSIVACLAICGRHADSRCLLCFALVFLILLLDDAASIHEWGGELLAGLLSLQPALGLRAQDFGELISWLALGVVVVASVVFGLMHAEGDDKSGAHRLCVALAALVAVGVGVDMAHIMVVEAMPQGWPRGATNLAFNVAEDGGEMLLASYAVAVAAAMVATARRRRYGKFLAGVRPASELAEASLRQDLRGAPPSSP